MMGRLEIPETAEELIRMLRQWGPSGEANVIVLAFEACVEDGEAILDRLLKEGRVIRVSDEDGIMRWVVNEHLN